MPTMDKYAVAKSVTKSQAGMKKIIARTISEQPLWPSPFSIAYYLFGNSHVVNALLVA